MILGTAGHIDHGKTSLVRALTGVDTDRLPEEKKRGITIDLGFAPLKLDDVGVVGVVDVPGHEGFIRTMLAGATGIDLGLLVVAADEGVMPQTLEHLEILRLLNVSVPVVAVTKSDLVDAEWRSLVVEDIRALVASGQQTAPEVIAVSVVTGDGIEELRTALALAFAGVSELEGDDIFRMPIDRVFTIRGTGTVVSGTVWSGSVAPADILQLLPSAREARVRRVETHGSIVERTGAGNRCAVALSNISVDEVERGDVLVGGRSWKPTTRLAVRMVVSEDFRAAVTNGRIVQMHLGTSSVSARVRFPFPDTDGISDYAVISLKSPLVARTGDRFVIRSLSPAATIGGGVVVDPFPARGSIKEAIEEAATGEKLLQLLRFAGLRGMPLEELPIRLGMPPAACSHLVDSLKNVLETDGILFSSEVADTLEARVFAILRENEVNDPLTRGVSLSTARMMTRAAELFDYVVRRVSDRGEFVVEDGLIRRASWAPSLNEAAQKLADAVLHDICACSKEPPSVGELVRHRGSRVPEILRFLQKQGHLVQVEVDRYYGAAVVEELIESLRGRMKGGQVHSPAELREILGFSRKFLIPFLEYCDRLGVTERRFEGRVLRGKG